MYAPGGTAAYPSSALMGHSATVAGVETVAVATLPAKELNPATLATIRVVGADRIYPVDDARAIAALAYGREAVDAVDTVIAPRNRWVTSAKAEECGDVAIDVFAGEHVGDYDIKRIEVALTLEEREEYERHQETFTPASSTNSRSGS